MSRKKNWHFHRIISELLHCIGVLMFLAGVSFAQIDRNRDGMSDLWQVEFGAQNLLPGADADGDGATNEMEARMGTDPFDSGSLLHTEIEADGETSARITWNTVMGKTYRPRLNTDLAHAPWIAPELHVGGIDDSPVTIVLSDGHIVAVEGVLERSHYPPWINGAQQNSLFENPIATSWVNQLANLPFSSLSYRRNPERIYGWVVPPEDGDYIFHHIFQENVYSEFWLSPDQDAANAVRKSFGDVDEDDYPRDGTYPFINTDAITLKAGQPVYLELRANENPGRGTQFNEIQWIPPGRSEAEPIPPSALRLYLPEAIPVLPENPEFWCAEIEVFDQDSDFDTITDWEELKADTFLFSSTDVGRSRDLEWVGEQYGLFSVVSLSILNEAGFTVVSEREAQVRRLRIRAERISGDTDLILPLRLTGTASAGSDYLNPENLQIRLPVGTDMTELDIRVPDDLIPEADEDIRLEWDFVPEIIVSPFVGNHRFVIRDDDRPVFGLEVVDAAATEQPLDTATIRAYRTGDLSAHYQMLVTQSGSAVEGLDYQPLPTIRFAAGQSEQLLTIRPIADGETEGGETVELRPAPSSVYDYRPHHVDALVTIRDTEVANRELYLARYGPEGPAETAAWGYATLELAPNRESAVINTRFANLTSPQTAAHIHQGPVGMSGPVVEGLANGEVSEHRWTFGADKDAMLNALENGLLYANVHSVNYPAGEIRGQFLPVSGSSTFSPPTAVPRNAGAPGIPFDEASRFLTQATFGPRLAEVERLRTIGIAAWLNEQIGEPATSHGQLLQAMRDMHQERNSDLDAPDSVLAAGAWWTSAIQGQDQLRQRMAFALSQILVISMEDERIRDGYIARVAYQDMLAQHAFGNYRDLLYDVAKNPLMGLYLSHLRNPKPDVANQIFPDENFAREVMQLFSIGLFELHPDGSLRLDPESGRPIPTYDHRDIQELARVFTGWGLAYQSTADPAARIENVYFHYRARDWGNETQIEWIAPTKLFPEYHDSDPKQLIGGLRLIGLDGEDELELAVDSLFLHPNTGPFLARRLIQRLVTSNPSPAYIYRVAQAFEDNGQGVRGDLATVMRAILLDPEARDMERTNQPDTGKLKEPILAVTQFLRAFPLVAGREYDVETIGDLAPYMDLGSLPATAPLISAYVADIPPEYNYYTVQVPLNAPSVFNFFDPDFQPPGPLAAARLTGPEFSYLNAEHTFLMLDKLFAQTTSILVWRPDPDEDNVVNRLRGDWPDTSDPGQIITDLERRLLGGDMSVQLSAILTRNLPAIPAEFRYRTALRLVLQSPEFFTQR